MLHAGVADHRRGDFRTTDLDAAAATSSDQACARGPGASGNYRHASRDGSAVMLRSADTRKLPIPLTPHRGDAGSLVSGRAERLDTDPLPVTRLLPHEYSGISGDCAGTVGRIPPGAPSDSAGENPANMTTCAARCTIAISGEATGSHNPGSVVALGKSSYDIIQGDDMIMQRILDRRSIPLGIGEASRGFGEHPGGRSCRRVLGSRARRVWGIPLHYQRRDHAADRLPAIYQAPQVTRPRVRALNVAVARERMPFSRYS